MKNPRPRAFVISINGVVQTPQEFTKEQAQEYTQKRGKNTRFYFNIYGWSSYFTLTPTFATPSGRLKDFPRCKVFKLEK